MSDPVTCPSHYQGDGVECKQALRARLGSEGMQAYWCGCAMKYLWRYDRKNGVEDLKKARECIDCLIKEIEDRQLNEVTCRWEGC